MERLSTEDKSYKKELITDENLKKFKPEDMLTMKTK